MDVRDLISNQNDVSLTLAKRVILTEAKETNSVFSPLSLHVVLGLIAAGSDGPTKDQLLSFLKSKSTDELNSLSSQLVTTVFADGSPSGGPRLSFANGVWIDQSMSLKPSFKKVADDVYKAASKQVDFQHKVANEVNAWSEKATNGLIKDILPPGSVDSSVRLIFANALYFKGAWDEKFDASKTKELDFHLLNGSTVKAPFMTSKKKQYVSTYDDFKVLCLPYKQGEDKRRFSMYFFLPDAKDGLRALVDKLDSQPGFIDRHLPRRKVEVGKFLLPKFKMSFGFEASKTLKDLGLILPFSDGGLSEIVDSSVGRNLFVSNIFHKSFIEVNEEGTEAAASTAAVVMLRALLVDDKPDFVADHPFLFVIREDMTGVVQFIGSVLNPTASAHALFHSSHPFTGVWDQKFDESKTKEHDFHLLNGRTVKAPFMTSKEEQYVSTYNDFKVLRLPYKQGEDKRRRFSIYFFLPNAMDGLQDLVDKLDSLPRFLDRHRPLRKVEVGDFLIPNFKISFGFEASETLKDLGLILPFIDGGLTEMVKSLADGGKLYVSNVFHKSFVEVNEEGTEAAA
ncbi:OLC1v1017805C1 [Oldenlandia corymbosa var. corymbosa]|uniref:OLC1v1017805C1 n=1 Tax=Oldenlandia corymbosa var. corymbosa TaxID=529605 RepID=A0AAV1EAJ3_OLDCO|nr:OLC1v1017805C1 [Oldenlandia corymbosa var. corymbosa]